MKTKLRLFAAGAFLAAGLPIGAHAQVTSPQTTTLNVSATVASICQLSAPGNIAFGSVQAGTTANGPGSVTVTCNRGATVSATTTSANASGTQKRMLLSGTDYLDYQVWQPDLANLGSVRSDADRLDRGDGDVVPVDRLGRTAGDPDLRDDDADEHQPGRHLQRRPDGFRVVQLAPEPGRATWTGRGAPFSFMQLT